ncbi:putative sugar O-methyltransferase [Hoeflea sp. WL0058]|uniref:Sugar O-methyltransferase n=1 Tax=Flavimaribacter sediminis TaxID=2865987 RepID=A0AAE2ZP61_9HYPH|nr:putative sugar O-methyltransferase [Flavimaribacter sediminis]MBW8638290.1 putative sugar O-methyltransferase [Flavimaribacter sediminis]
MLMECLAALVETGDIELLKKHPCHPAGNPRTFDWNGIPVTHRWIKHIHHLGMFNRTLSASLKEGFSVLDIGSSYGVFSYMMFREYPGSHHVLVDLPNQLLFAHYFLRNCFPDARIAGARTIEELGAITRETVDAYDFILLPADRFEQLAGGSIDLVTSFSCLGELKRTLFDRYIRSDAFLSARYFYTSNPVDKHMAMQDAEVCVLDYPILDPAKRLYFGVSPVFLYSYGAPERKGPFGYRLRPMVPYFESITEI